MKVLTLHQPYATLIALGVKTIETRPNAFPSLVGQRIAIHAAADRGLEPAATTICNALLSREIEPIDVPLGAIVCTAVVEACVPYVESTLFRSPPMLFISTTGHLLHWRCSVGSNDGAHFGGEWDDITDQLPYGDFGPGRFGLILTDVEVLPEPVPFKGGQGLSRSWEPAVAS